MKMRFLIISFIFFILAIAAIAGCVTLGTTKSFETNLSSGKLEFISLESGLDGAALGIGIVGAAFILSGAFFLYKAFEGGTQSPR